MIIFNNTNDLINSLTLEKENLKFNMDSAENTKRILLQYIQNFANSTDNIDENLVNNVSSFLQSLKDSLNLCNENIAYLSNLLDNFNNVLDCANNNILEFKKTLDAYNSKYIDSNKHILENSKKIEECFLHVSEEIKFSFFDSINETQVNNINPVTSQITEQFTDTSENNINTNNESSDNANYNEHTLVISERTGHVVLPYSLKEIESIIEKYPNKYFSIDSVISKKYTLPIKIFKNFYVARFREAYKLMRNKEKASIRDALDLGLELMFYNKLHPAIISACKNLEELDEYLDYMEIDRLEEFNYFKVIFELPLAIKNNHSNANLV